jgi:branched-chain amino acid transport system permease protein
LYKALFDMKTTLIGLVLLALLLMLPQFLPRFYVYLLALIFAIALLATSLNLVLGFGGMYQFHHAVFYGFGAYAFALFATKSGLPLWMGYAIAPFCSAALGLALGLITVRLNQLYFGMLQISLGSLVWAITYRWYSFTGGDDGIHGIPLPDLVGSSTGAYYFNLIVAASLPAVDVY